MAFDKQKLISGIDESGNYTYADGLFDGDNTIYINNDSKRRYSSVIFHELMHALVKNTARKSEFRLGKKLLRTATKKMDSERRSKIEKAYKKYYKSLGTDISSVVLADEILSHYTEDVMGDIDVLEFLEGEVPGLGKRIIGFFNESARTHSGDENLSREARKYARRFRELYRQIEQRHKGMNATEGVKFGERMAVATEETKEIASYSEYDKPITLKDVDILRSIGRKSINDFTSEDIKKSQKWAHKFYKELGAKSPFFRAWFGEWRAFSNSDIDVVDTKSDNRKEIVNKDTGWIIKASKKVHKETSSHQGSTEVNAVKYLPYIDDITKKAILFDSVVSNNGNENSLMFHTMYAYTETMGYPALLKLKVEELFYFNNKETGIFQRDYILQNIEEESISKRNRLSRPNHLKKDSSVISISDLYEFVKQFDKDFTPAPAIGADAAKYLLNKDGTPKVFYHGTNQDFTAFSYGTISDSTGVGILGEGFYFTDKKNLAKNYGNKVMPCYLQIRNPYIANNNELYQLNTSELSKQGYDGVILKSPNGTIYMVFDNTQIKSATDNIGTFDKTNPDIRYALDIDSETDADELPNTLDSVAKSRETYSPGFWKRLFNVADKLYIETVDELFGAQKYIEKVGKRKDAAAIVNMARSSRAQAQTMIGSVQYDLFSGNYEELGEGIQEILAPITKVNKAKGETHQVRRARVERFNDYMHSRKGAELIRFGRIYFSISFAKSLLNIIYFSIDLACL